MPAEIEKSDYLGLIINVDRVMVIQKIFGRQYCWKRYTRQRSKNLFRKALFNGEDFKINVQFGYTSPISIFIFCPEQKLMFAK